MRMVAVSLSAVVASSFFGCVVAADEPDEHDVEQEPRQRECGAVGDLVDDGAQLEGLGNAVVVAAEVSADRAVVHFAPAGDVSRDLAFVVDAARLPLLPPAGPVEFFVRQGNCFGEGCDPAFFSLRTTAGFFFFVGRANALDDAAVFTGPASDAPVQVRRGTGDDLCVDTAEDGALAVVVVAADDGPVEFVAGDAADVVIDGERWCVIVGDASRREFVQSDEPCVDCAAPGLHSDTAIEFVLYRVADR